MDFSGRFLISLPMVAGLVLLVGLIAGFAVTTLRRGGFAPSAGVVVGTMAGSGALAFIATSLIGMLRPGEFWRAEPLWAHLATDAGVLLVGILLLATIGRGASLRQLRSTFWLLFLALGAVIGLAAPGGIVFFLFPPLLVGAGMIADRRWRGAELAGSAAGILFLTFTWGAMLGLLDELLSGGPIWLFAPLGTLLLLPVLIEAKPLIDGAGLRGAGALAGILLASGWAAAAAAPAYSADRQQRFVIQHVTDSANGKSWWSVVSDGAPLPKAFGAGWKRGRLPLGDARRWFKGAPADPSSRPPAVQLLSKVQSGNERTLILRLSANGNDDVELIAPEDSEIRSAGVNGFVRPIDQYENGKFFIGCSGRSCEGMTLQLTLDHARPVDFLLVGSRDGLPRAAAALIAARARFARPQYSPDASIAFAHASL